MIYWLKQVGQRLLDAYDPEEVAQVSELDELETFGELKKQNLALDSGRPLSSRHLGLGVRRLEGDQLTTDNTRR